MANAYSAKCPRREALEKVTTNQGILLGVHLGDKACYANALPYPKPVRAWAQTAANPSNVIVGREPFM